MLKIREEQIARFEEPRQAEIVIWLIDRLDTMYPELIWEMPKEQVRATVERSVERAKPYGIRERADLLVYVRLTLQYGENFEANPKHGYSQRILLATNLAGGAKIEWLSRIYDLR
ncbi:MAG: hypothetical protein R3F37_18525 [Candidatus Competibacteraceae bacterium]